jgi:hypothetical protein
MLPTTNVRPTSQYTQALPFDCALRGPFVQSAFGQDRSILASLCAHNCFYSRIIGLHIQYNAPRGVCQVFF